MKLTKAELKFILVATNVGGAVYDIENNTDKEFKKAYGISKADVDKTLSALQAKVRAELKK